MDAGLKRAIHKGLVAARANLIPGLVIWSLAAAVIAAWTWSAWFGECLNDITLFKNQWNYIFAFCSTAIAGGVIPGMVQGIFRLHPKAWSQIWLVSLFWGIKGIEINAFYEMQAYLFGNGNDMCTIVSKTLFDQLVYIPLWAVPSMIVGYGWIEHGSKGVMADFRHHWFKESYLPILLANGAIWIPTVILIYILPTQLQLPLQNLVLCFWGLIMGFMASQKELAETQVEAH